MRNNKLYYSMSSYFKYIYLNRKFDENFAFLNAECHINMISCRNDFIYLCIRLLSSLPHLDDSGMKRSI